MEKAKIIRAQTPQKQQHSGQAHLHTHILALTHSLQAHTVNQPTCAHRSTHAHMCPHTCTHTRTWEVLTLVVNDYLLCKSMPLPFTSLLSSGICKASSGNPFCLFAFLFVGDGFGHCLLNDAMNLCLSSGILSTRSTLLNLFVTSTV